MRVFANQFFSTVARNLLIKGVGIPASFICTIILANNLDSADIGKLALLMSVATVASSGFTRIYSVLLVREISAAISLNNKNSILGVIILCLALLIIPLIVISNDSIVRYLFNIESSAFLISLTALILVTVLFGATLRGLKQVEKGLVVEQVARPVFQLVFLLCYVYAFSTIEPLNYQSALIILLLSFLIAGIIGVAMVSSSLYKLRYFAKPAIENSWLTKSAPVLLVLGYLGGINIQLPYLLLGNFATTVETAQFKVAVSIASLIGVTLLAVNMALGPKLASLGAKNNLRDYEHTLRQACSMVTYLALPMAAVIILFSDYIVLALFSSDYAQAANILWICCLAQVTNSLCGPAALAFNMLKSEKMNVLALCLSLTIGLLIGQHLTTLYGAAGAAVTALLSVTTWSIFLVCMLKIKFNIICLPYMNPRRIFEA